MNIKKICAVLDEFEKEGCFGSVRITEKDRVIFERNLGYANIDAREEFTKESMFTLYSISKPFCAIGLMKLYDKGLLNIEDHPGKYLKEAAGFHKDLKIYQLLNHTSGIPDFVQTSDFFKEYGTSKKSERELLPALSGYEGFFEPGAEGRYTNVNFVIPALMIENISGMPYAEYMKKEVFEPLGMEKATVDFEGNNIEKRVVGYDKNERGELIPLKKTYFSMFGAGDIVCTVDDVYRLNLAIKNKSLLKPETWERILTPSPINGMGYGCSVYDWYGKTRIQHNGGSAGFRTLHFMLPREDFDVIFLSNSGFGEYRHLISEAIHDACFGGSREKEKSIEMDKGYI